MTSEFVQLIDGPLVRESALRLLLDLEERGHEFRADNGKLTVTDGSRLTTDDRAAITRERLHLLAVVGYCQEGHEPR